MSAVPSGHRHGHGDAARDASTAHARWLIALQAADASPDDNWAPSRERIQAIDAHCRRTAAPLLDLREVPEVARPTLMRVSRDGWRALDDSFKASTGKAISTVLLPAFPNDPESRRAAELAALLTGMLDLTSVSIACGMAGANGVSKTDLLPLGQPAPGKKPPSVTLRLPAWAFSAKVTAPEGLRVATEPSQSRPFKATVAFRRQEGGHTRDRVVPLLFENGSPVGGSAGGATPSQSAMLNSEPPSEPPPEPAGPLPLASELVEMIARARKLALRDARAALRQLAAVMDTQQPRASTSDPAIRKIVQLATGLDGSRDTEIARTVAYPIALRDFLTDREMQRLRRPPLGTGSLVETLEDALNRLALARDLEAADKARATHSRSTDFKAGEVLALVDKMAHLAHCLKDELPHPLPETGLTRWAARLMRGLRLKEHPLNEVKQQLRGMARTREDVPEELMQLLGRCLVDEATRDDLRLRHGCAGTQKRLAIEHYFQLCHQVRMLRGEEPTQAADPRSLPDAPPHQARRADPLIARRDRLAGAVSRLTDVDPAMQRRLNWLLDRLDGAFDQLERAYGDDEDAFCAAEEACTEAVVAIETLLALTPRRA